MYAKLVEKCGDRLYWENWAKEIGLIAHKFIERISKLIQSGIHKKAFNEYLKGLQRDLNPSVDASQAIEMLAQHIITRPVFDALFADYQFVNNNAVSRSMQRMIDLLQEQAFEKDTEILDKFYKSVRMNVGGIDNLEGKQTKWADLMADTPPILKANGEKLDGPLYGVLRTPQANNVDISTPLGLPIFAEAIEELKDLDIAYSRNAGEIFNSQKIVLADDRLLMPSGTPVSAMSPQGMENRRNEMNLPHFVKNVFGQDEKEFYQEINPQLNTDTRISGINALLSQLGYKIGFSNGYFVFNESSGIQTATGVEAEQQRTVQFIKDVRDKLESCLDEVIYALNVYADLYGLTPVGAYEVNYDFGDILYVRENDRARWWQYVITGKVPAWLYFVKFEGMTEEEAKAMVKEAQPDEPTLFGEE